MHSSHICYRYLYASSYDRYEPLFPISEDLCCMYVWGGREVTIKTVYVCIMPCTWVCMSYVERGRERGE